jgi:SAM-dependent methyltransferase
VAIDRSEQALAMARAIDADPGDAHIQYRAVDLSGELPDLGHFDAIVGRRVLMYLPDAAKTLERLAATAKPDAILAFQEHARTGLPAGLGDLTLHRQLYDWNWRTVAAEGGDVGLGLRLAELMQQLGLSIEQARGEAILLHPDQPSFLPTLTHAMLPRIVERGIATVEQIDLNTLSQRIKDEHRAIGGTIVWTSPSWSRPGSSQFLAKTCAIRLLRARDEEPRLRRNLYRQRRPTSGLEPPARLPETGHLFIG